jgi:hypothetical protein
MTDYKAILDDAFTKLGFALQARDAADVEIAKQKQFIFATLNMISDEERQQFEARVNAAFEKSDALSAGLTDAIRKILHETGREYITVARVRDRLVKSGFDFTGYTANPLASISTTLRRMKPEEVETTKIKTVTAYRLKLKFSKRLKGRFSKE